MRWKIYYGDGSTYSDRDGSPYLAPILNVQVIVQDSDNILGRTLMHGATPPEKGNFVWQGNGWNICDTVGFWDYMMHYEGPKAALFGRSINTQDFEAILKRAISEGTS